jgi:hypothetical protein
MINLLAWLGPVMSVTFAVAAEIREEISDPAEAEGDTGSIASCRMQLVSDSVANERGAYRGARRVYLGSTARFGCRLLHCDSTISMTL